MARPVQPSDASGIGACAPCKRPSTARTSGLALTTLAGGHRL